MRIIGMSEKHMAYCTKVRSGFLGRHRQSFAHLDAVGWFQIQPTFRAATDSESKLLMEHRRQRTLDRIRRESVEKERNKELDTLRAYRASLCAITGLPVSEDIEL